LTLNHNLRHGSHPFPLSRSPLRLDFYHPFRPGKIVTKAAPRPILRFLHEFSFHGIAMDVAQLLNAFGLAWSLGFARDFGSGLGRPLNASSSWRSFVTFTVIRSSAGWSRVPRIGLGVVFVTTWAVIWEHVEIESQWTARRRERAGIFPTVRVRLPAENPRPSGAWTGHPRE